MKKAALLIATHAVVGGVKIEGQLGGGLLEVGDELVQKHLVHGEGALAVGAFFESAESGAGGEGRVAVDRGLPEQIMAQGVMIAEIFVALDEAQDALAKELLLGVGDEARVAVVGHGLAQIPDEPEARIHLADEQQAAVAGDVAALE